VAWVQQQQGDWRLQSLQSLLLCLQQQHLGAGEAAQVEEPASGALSCCLTASG
jgi:hypothetical protein